MRHTAFFAARESAMPNDALCRQLAQRVITLMREPQKPLCAVENVRLIYAEGPLPRTPVL